MPSSDPSDFVPESCLVRFRPLSVLADGGHGRVLRALDVARGCEIALKVLHDPGDAEEIERFLAEARIAAQLAHPHIVRVIDAGFDGVPWIAYELLGGQSLRRVLERGPVSIPDVLRIGAQLADALAHAHQHGVLHRDLKPENVLEAAPGHVKLVDFGIAKLVSGGIHTQAGVIVGTPHYVSPEQVRGQPAAPQSDIYSLGVLVFELTTGTVPFSDTALVELLRARLCPAPRLRSRRADAPVGLEELVGSLLAVDPTDRIASAADARERFLELAGRTEPTPTPRVLRPAVAFTDRPGLPRTAGIRATAVALTVALATVANLYFARSPGRGPTPAPMAPAAPVSEAPSRPGAQDVDPAPEADPSALTSEADALERSVRAMDPDRLPAADSLPAMRRQTIELGRKLSASYAGSLPAELVVVHAAGFLTSALWRLGRMSDLAPLEEEVDRWLTRPSPTWFAHATRMIIAQQISAGDGAMAASASLELLLKREIPHASRARWLRELTRAIAVLDHHRSGFLESFLKAVRRAVPDLPAAEPPPRLDGDLPQVHRDFTGPLNTGIPGTEAEALSELAAVCTAAATTTPRPVPPAPPWSSAAERSRAFTEFQQALDKACRRARDTAGQLLTAEMAGAVEGQRILPRLATLRELERALDRAILAWTGTSDERDALAIMLLHAWVQGEHMRILMRSSGRRDSTYEAKRQLRAGAHHRALVAAATSADPRVRQMAAACRRDLHAKWLEPMIYEDCVRVLEPLLRDP